MAKRKKSVRLQLFIVQRPAASLSTLGDGRFLSLYACTNSTGCLTVMLGAMETRSGGSGAAATPS